MDKEQSHNWVISGISGRLPISENLQIFWEQLIEGNDMISEINGRWDTSAYEMPDRMGIVPFIEKFDASFFGVSGIQANHMDPKIRILLEVTYETITDAGINYKSLDGKRVGVFMATSFSEALSIWARSSLNPGGNYVLGCHPCLMADRIAYTFNFKGPSCALDSACSTSFTALQYACLALNKGICNSAIVGGASINLLPSFTEICYRHNVLSADGKCKVFDADCDGFVRSEAIVALYICCKDNAKRSYATIAGIKCCSNGYTPEGISVPSVEMQVQIMREVYLDAGVSPLDVSYVEAHGTGTKAGDPIEIIALAQVFCEGRKKPLLVGSGKSNIGHTEPVSGLCGIVKVLLSNLAGIIPRNLHFKTPNPQCEALLDGRIQIVTEPQPFKGRFVGINSFGIGGTSGHLLLEFDDVEPKLVKEFHSNDVLVDEFKSEDIPVLILASGRTKQALEYFLNQAMNHSDNAEFVGLLHELAIFPVPKHGHVGFALIKSTGDFEVIIEESKESTRTIWYIYTGLGSQWVGMIDDMIKFKCFKASIHASSNILGEVGVDLKFLFQTRDEQFLSKLQNMLVVITATQIGLTELLRSLGLEPGGIIGHSHGESLCAYADGCLTHKQTILVAHYKAKAILEADMPQGAMASVGMSWEDAQTYCPVDVYPAIYYAENNITVSGPIESIHTFVDQVKGKGKFAKVVKSAEYAFHTLYMKRCERLMLELLEKVIPEPTKRSNKWLSSSIPYNEWGSDLSKCCSAQYLVNNAMSTVKMSDVLQHVPQNALVLEVGPHCFLQTILKLSLADIVVVVGLMHCKHENSLYFLKSLGTIFCAGFHISISTLYKPLTFPVSMKTPMISPLVKWDHSNSWEVPNYNNEMSPKQRTKFVIDLSSDEALRGHVIQDKIIFPATGCIWLVWKVFARMHDTTAENLPIHLENINFTQMIEFPQNQKLEILVTVLNKNGYFQIVVGDTMVCYGSIQRANQNNLEGLETAANEDIYDTVLVQDDFYKLLLLKGYQYQGLFQGVQNIDSEGRWAEIQWNDNWICFLDAMLQTWILESPSKELDIPVRLKEVTINAAMFRDSIGNHSTVSARQCKYLDTVQCPGIKICGFTKSISLLHTSANPTILAQRFSPYFDPPTVTVPMGEALEFFFGVVIENFSEFGETFVFTEVLENCVSVRPNLLPLIFLKFDSFETRIIREQIDEKQEAEGICQILDSLIDASFLSPSHLILTNNNEKVFQCMPLLFDNGFVLLITTSDEIASGLTIIAKRHCENEVIYLLRKITCGPLTSTLVSVDTYNFEWVDVLKDTLMFNKDIENWRLNLISYSSISGIIGLINCLLKEPGCQHIRCIHMCDSKLDDEQLSAILKKDLVFNVLKKCVWGTYTNFAIKDFGIPRMSEKVYCNALTIGDISSLCWIESSCKLHQREYIEVHYSPLNFKDVMYITGKLSKSAFGKSARREECLIGSEFSGLFKSNRVCGTSLTKCITSYLDHDPNIILNVPYHLTLAEVATVPTVYITVLYAMLIRGKLLEGETVLIHSGAGGVGLAAITIALHFHCVVFTTVGSKEKRQFLKNKFPGLQEERILDLTVRSNFKEEILRQTQGKGVNLVLNSLALDQLKASLDCLSMRGRFLEIGKFDSFKNSLIGLEILLKCVDIQAIHLDLSMQTNSDEKHQVQKIVQTYMDQGKLKPLVFTLFGHKNLEQAFRYMANRNHVGKIIIKIRESSENVSIAAIPRTYFYTDKTYIIIGGLGGMGLEIVSWMIERGAKNLFILSRSGVTTSYQKYMVKNWRNVGANIFLRNPDVSVESEVFELMMEAISVGPLGGVFNLAIVLQDGIFVNQSAETFRDVSKCKADASVHFDNLSRKHAPSMDYFVVFSSVSSGRGNAGQSNYGLANSVMERICEQRKEVGLPALAIQWGPVADVGSAVTTFKDKNILGVLGQPIASCISTFDLFLQQTETVVSSILLPDKSRKASSDSKIKSLAEKVANILGITDFEKIDLSSTLRDNGMDSIMESQVKITLSRLKKITVPDSAYGQLTFKELLNLEFKDNLLP